MKQDIEKYLYENYVDILYKTKEFGFKWKDIANDFANKNNVDVPDSEYIRNIWRRLKKKIEAEPTALANEDIKWTEPKFQTTTSIAPLLNFKYQSGKEDKQNGKKEFTFTADNIPSESEIVEHFNIDTVKYRINQIYHKTSFGGKYAITVSLLANKPEFSVDYKKEFEEFLKQHNLSILNRPIIKQLEQNKSFEKKNSILLNLSDLHVGKLAWDKEVGTDYNVDLAKQVFIEALQNLTYQSVRCFGIEEFVLNIGGDFLHTNGSSNTTANGTIMNDVDTRYQKIFTKGLEILTEAIDFLASFEGVKVKVFVVQGNHDKATSFYLGESLKAFYKKDKNVDIINDPHVRKYHKYGVSSYMLTHGDCKDDGLPLTFATEKPDYFANSLYRYIFLGHLHKSSRKVYLTENEVNGVVSRRLNSLSPTDAWHSESNFIGAKRMANALVFDKENGQIAEFNYIVKK